MASFLTGKELITLDFISFQYLEFSLLRILCTVSSCYKLLGGYGAELVHF